MTSRSDTLTRQPNRTGIPSGGSREREKASQEAFLLTQFARANAVTRPFAELEKPRAWWKFWG